MLDPAAPHSAPRQALSGGAELYSSVFAGLLAHNFLWPKWPLKH
jgi:hypothetical protein